MRNFRQVSTDGRLRHTLTLNIDNIIHLFNCLEFYTHKGKNTKSPKTK